MKKFVLRSAPHILKTPNRVLGVYDPNSLSGFLSEARENGQNFVCFKLGQWAAGLGCSTCLGDTPFSIEVATSKVRDREKGNFIYSIKCVMVQASANPPITYECCFEGNSVTTERS